jgi:hypothetical protein
MGHEHLALAGSGMKLKLAPAESRALLALIPDGDIRSYVYELNQEADRRLCVAQGHPYPWELTVDDPVRCSNCGTATAETVRIEAAPGQALSHGSFFAPSAPDQDRPR